MTFEIMTVLSILIVTVILLIFEVLRIDLIAILCMLALGWSGILTPGEALSGFSSNAVIAMMAVMVMGIGIAKTGVMNTFAGFILRIAGSSKRKLIGLVSTCCGTAFGIYAECWRGRSFFAGSTQYFKTRKNSCIRIDYAIGICRDSGRNIDHGRFRSIDSFK